MRAAHFRLLLPALTVAFVLAVAPAVAQEPGVKLQMRVPLTEGPLAEGSVTAAFERNKEALRACFVPREGRAPEGLLHVFFFVGPDGKAFKAEVGASSLRRPDVETCVKRQVLSWDLGKPSSPEPTTADFLLVSAAGS